MRKGLAEGQWKSAREIQRWLKSEHHKELKLAAIYYWLGQVRASGKVPRKSQKKKDPQQEQEFKEEVVPR